MLGMGGMAGAAGNLDLAPNHIKSSLLILQVFHDDAKVLCHCPHLIVKMLLQFAFSFFRCSGLPTQLRPNDPIPTVVLGGIPHYHILPLGIRNDLIVDGVRDFKGLLMMFQGSNHKGDEIRPYVGI